MTTDVWTQVAQSANVSGERRRVDITSGCVTIKHGPISTLGLPAITVVYRAAPHLLKRLKPGDNVNFIATRQNDNYIVKQISK